MPPDHEQFMQRCLELAARGAGHVAPNPMVGCVIVHEGKIIAEGWHRKYGENHAERDAILKLWGDPRLKNSQLYVNLEPCAHHGKTPPCADLIVEAGIPEVIIGSPDPFAEVNGKGIAKLRMAGVQVTENILRNPCDFLNRRFLLFHTQRRPWIILKWAETADGFMAPEDHSRKQISGRSAAVLLHKWRAEEAAILVGAHTVNHDKPSLNVRLWQGKNPQRFVLDGNLSQQYPYDENAISVFNFLQSGQEENCTFIKIPKENSLQQVLEYLYQNQVQSILIEGGKQVLTQFLDAGLWDEVRIIKSKEVYFHTGIQAPGLQLKPDETEELDEDIVKYYRRPNP